MTLKICTCGKIQTTRNSKFIGRMLIGKKMLLFNCKSCRTTFAVVLKKQQTVRGA